MASISRGINYFSYRLRMRTVPLILLSLALALMFSATAFAAKNKKGMEEKAHAVVSVQQAKVYDSASSDGEVIAKIPRGEELIVVEWTDDGYCYVEIGSESGYIKNTHLKKISILERYSPSKRGQVNADGVNLRTRWDLESSIISVLKKNVQVEIISRVENWYKVSVGLNVGYINIEYINLDDSTSTDSYTTLRMGMSGREVARMQQALLDLGFFKGEVNGNFGARTRDAVKAFQQANNLDTDGVAGQDTLEKLYS